MKKYLILIIILVSTCTSILAQVDRTKAPQAAPAPKIQFGNATKFELPNELKIFVVENHRIPKVSFSISLIFDPALEQENTGIGSLTSTLIGTGTKTRTKDQIDEEIDFIGASLSASADGIYASSLKKHTKKLLEILSDVTINSVFNNDELEKKRTQLLSGLATEKDDPNAIAGNVFSALVYGKNHPYGEFETETSVKNVTLQMCNNYYKKYFKPNIAYLTVIGDITPAEAKKLIDNYFKSWQKGLIEMQYYPKPQPPKTREVALVDRPQSVQSVINIGYPVDLNVSNPDYIKARVTNTLLGGSEFRLFMNLREKHAYTYGAYSNFSINPLISSFKASASVRNAVTDSSITQILYEMNRLRDEPVPVAELNVVKNYMTGNFALSLENPQTIASFAVNTERYKLPQDFYANYLKNIEAVTVNDVQQMAKKYITPDQSIILVVGKSSDIAEKLKRFSPSEKIETYDSNANLYDASKKVEALPMGITAQTILNKYVDAIGGIKNVEKVKDLTIKANLNIQGNVLNVNIIYKLPGKFVSEVVMNGQTFQKQLLNGEIAKVSGMQGDRDVQGTELEKMKIDAEPFPEIKYEELGYKAQLKEISEIDGKKAYQVEITSPAGNSSTDYFSVETGLKIRSESAMDTQMGKISQITDFVEYTEIEGVKFPKKMTQTMGPQSFEIIVDSISINSNVKDEIFN